MVIKNFGARILFAIKRGFYGLPQKFVIFSLSSSSLPCYVCIWLLLEIYLAFLRLIPFEKINISTSGLWMSFVIEMRFVHTRPTEDYNFDEFLACINLILNKKKTHCLNNAEINSFKMHKNFYVLFWLQHFSFSRLFANNSKLCASVLQHHISLDFSLSSFFFRSGWEILQNFLSFKKILAHNSTKCFTVVQRWPSCWICCFRIWNSDFWSISWAELNASRSKCLLQRKEIEIVVSSFAMVKWNSHRTGKNDTTQNIS